MTLGTNRNITISLPTVTNLGILFFYILSTVYSYYVYQNFSFLEIVCLSIIFLTFLSVLAKFFDYRIFYFKTNKKGSFLALVSALFLFLLSTSFENRWVNSYFTTFPLAEAELGLGWFKDSVFHTSIIQSILNFGYPSSSQHGSPLLIYHTLSHYIDSLILFITKLEPYDSYGLLKSFKIFVFLSALLLLVGRISGDNIWLYILMLFIIIPAFVGTWHVIGSHSMWVPTTILLLSSPLVFDIIKSNNEISRRTFIFLFFLIICISLGKISTGFIYAAFIGFLLLLKRPTDLKVYFLGSLWLVFFYLYFELMLTNAAKIKSNEVSFEMVYKFIFDSRIYFYIQPALISFIVILLINLTYRSKNNLNLTLSSAAIIIISFFIYAFSEKASIGNAYAYFSLATSQVILIYLILNTSMHILEKKDSFDIKTNPLSFSRYAFIPLSLIVSGYYFYTPSFSFFKINIENLEKRIEHANSGLFRKINKKLADKDKLSVSKTLFKPGTRGITYINDSYFSDFRKASNNLLSTNNLNKNDVVMFIPNEVFLDTIYDYGSRWDYGMFIYSLTGIPLTNSLTLDQVKGFSWYTYGEESRRKSKADFNSTQACIEHNVSGIVIVESLYPPNINLHSCSKP